MFDNKIILFQVFG